ncbi:hypothetical protein C8R47DRAFT_1189634, partial [Mycena vitilis]
MDLEDWGGSRRREGDGHRCGNLGLDQPYRDMRLGRYGFGCWKGLARWNRRWNTGLRAECLQMRVPASDGALERGGEANTERADAQESEGGDGGKGRETSTWQINAWRCCGRAVLGTDSRSAIFSTLIHVSPQIPSSESLEYVVAPLLPLRPLEAPSIKLSMPRPPETFRDTHSRPLTFIDPQRPGKTHKIFLMWIKELIKDHQAVEDYQMEYFWALISPSPQHSVSYLKSDLASAAARQLECGQYLAIVLEPSTVHNPRFGPQRPTAMAHLVQRADDVLPDTYLPIAPCQVQSPHAPLAPGFAWPFGDCVIYTGKRFVFDTVDFDRTMVDPRHVLPPDVAISFTVICDDDDYAQRRINAARTKVEKAEVGVLDDEDGDWSHHQKRENNP